MKRETLDALRAAAADKRAVALLTGIPSGRQALVYADAEPGAGFPFAPALVDAARGALRRDRSGMEEADGGRVFVQVFNPPLRMYVVGAVHITQFLAPMAQLAGFAVSVVDPRRAFASPERFPGVRVLGDWPDEALGAEGLDRRSAVVTLTHDPKLDDPALHVALRSPAFYVGCLGSRRTHAARCERLRRAGFGDADLERIHAPVGLDIGASSPAEIAAATVAEVIRALRTERGR